MRADELIEGLSRKQLEARLAECRQKQRDLAELKTKAMQAAFDRVTRKVERDFSKHFGPLFMWDRRYCAALAAMTGEVDKDG